MTDKKQFPFNGMIAICRKIYGDDLLRLTDALYKGGVRQIEVTFDQSDPGCMEITPNSVYSLCRRFPDMDIGAGTVLTVEQASAAHEAGARFIVSPNTDVDVIKRSKELGMLSVPGAMTPTEIAAAHKAGADIVKLFPADSLGAGYIKSICSPLPHIPLLATGGVNLDNFADFLRAGCCGAGLGGSLCGKKMIAERDWDGLADTARRYADIFREIKGDAGSAACR